MLVYTNQTNTAICTLICRERNDGLYRVITYLVAKIIEELGLALLCSIVFCEEYVLHSRSSWLLDTLLSRCVRGGAEGGSTQPGAALLHPCFVSWLGITSQPAGCVGLPSLQCSAPFTHPS